MIASTIRRCDGGSAVSPSLVSFQGYALAERCGLPAKIWPGEKSTLTSSNPVESMISIARTTNRNVTRRRDGQMVLRGTRHRQGPAILSPCQGL
jgi:hypothetical protein